MMLIPIYPLFRSMGRSDSTGYLIPLLNFDQNPLSLNHKTQYITTDPMLTHKANSPIVPQWKKRFRSVNLASDFGDHF